MTSLMTLIQRKIENYIIIASLKSESVGKLIYRIPGSRLLILSLRGLALRTHVEQQAFSKPCLVKSISKDTHLVFSMKERQLVLEFKVGRYIWTSTTRDFGT